MGRHPQRECLVKELRKAASKCGAARVPEMAARSREYLLERERATRTTRARETDSITVGDFGSVVVL